MLGLQFDMCNPIGFSGVFDACILNYSTFYQMKIKRLSFNNSQLQGVDFTEAEIVNIEITHCDLLNAKFERTNLEGADLRNSFNYSIDPEINRIRGASFSLQEVAGLLDKYDINVDR